MCLDLTDSHSDLFDKIQWQLEMHGRQVVNEHYKLQNHAQIPQLGSQEVASQSSKESSQPLHGWGSLWVADFQQPQMQLLHGIQVHPDCCECPPRQQVPFLFTLSIHGHPLVLADSWIILNPQFDKQSAHIWDCLIKLKANVKLTFRNRIQFLMVSSQTTLWYLMLFKMSIAALRDLPSAYSRWCTHLNSTHCDPKASAGFALGNAVETALIAPGSTDPNLVLVVSNR